MKIEVIQEENAPHTFFLAEAPLLIGRAPSNDIVVTDDQVSWHHAAVWAERGKVFVRDMGSKNGTLRNGQRIRGAEPIESGDTVTLGPNTRVVVQDGASISMFRSLLIEDIDSGVRTPLRSDRFHIGSGHDADLLIDDAPARAATLLIEEETITLGTDDSALELQPGQVFEVSGTRLRVVEMPPTHAPTVEPESDRYPYRLTATLNGATGPEAHLEDPRAQVGHTVDAENRAILLYLLARKVSEDLAAKVPAADAGWVSDEEVSVGIWGRGGPGDANSLHVLVYRLRKEVKKAGFDPWFIEKRRRALRVRLRDVRLS